MAKKDRQESSSAGASSPKQRSARYKAEFKTQDAAAYLEAIAGALRENRLAVPTDKSTLDFPVGPTLSLDLGANTSRGGRKTSLELTLKWRERPDRPAKSDGVKSEEAIPETPVTPASEPTPEADAPVSE